MELSYGDMMVSSALERMGPREGKDRDGVPPEMRALLSDLEENSLSATKKTPLTSFRCQNGVKITRECELLPVDVVVT